MSKVTWDGGHVSEGSATWSRMILPEISLPRHNTVHGKYHVTLDKANYSYHVKVAAINSVGQMGQWSQHHTFRVHFIKNHSKGELSETTDIVSDLIFC